MNGIATPYPGYQWNYDPYIGAWSSNYCPIPNVYSPPVLHPAIQKGYFYFEDRYAHRMGAIIGKNGFHFKNITRISGCVYIYNIGNLTVEMWGSTRAITHAMFLMKRHLQHLDRKDHARSIQSNQRARMV